MTARIAKFVFIFQLLFCSYWMIAPARAAEQKFTVAIVIDADSRIHDKAVVGIKQAIDEHANGNIDLRIININNSDDSASANSPDIDYAISVGVKPALFTLKQNSSYPVLYSLIPEITYKKIISEQISSNNHSPSNDYVIYLGQTASRQLALTELVTGKKCSVGTVVGEDSSRQVNKLKVLSQQNGIQLIVKQTLSDGAAIDDIKQVLMDSDIYLAVYDSKILSRHNAKWLLYMAYKMNKPVIGFSPSYTRAGAVASIFSTPEQIGRQSGEWLLDMMNHRPVAKHQHPKYFNVTTNPNIQRTLKLERLSGEVLKQGIQSLENADRHD